MFGIFFGYDVEFLFGAEEGALGDTVSLGGLNDFFSWHRSGGEEVGEELLGFVAGGGRS